MPRSITSADKEAMAALVEAAIKRLFLPDAGVTLNGQPVRAFLAGTAPTNLWSKLQWDVGREACRRWASGKTDSILPSRESFLRDTCTPYITAAFGAPSPAVVTSAVIGGQCVGTSYFVPVEVFNTTTQQWGVQTNLSGCFGPITSIVVTSESQFSSTLRVSCNNSSGTPVQRTSQQNVEALRLRAGTIGVSGGGYAGLCGNAPATWAPGTPSSGVPGPAPIPDPVGVPWLFPPVTVALNPDGTITVSFGGGTAPITIDPGIEPSLPSLPPPGGGTAGTPVATGVGGEADGDAPSGKMLWGLKVTITTAPANANQFSPGIYRGVCYVYMGDENGLDNDTAGATMASGQMVLAERDYLTKWRVVANDGYNLSITPYYKDTEA